MELMKSGNESDTPRTDAVEFMNEDWDVVFATTTGLCRELERETATLRAAISTLLWFTERDPIGGPDQVWDYMCEKYGPPENKLGLSEPGLDLSKYRKA